MKRREEKEPGRDDEMRSVSRSLSDLQYDLLRLRQEVEQVKAELRSAASAIDAIRRQA